MLRTVSVCNVDVTMINSRLTYTSLILIDTHGREDINLNQMILNLIYAIEDQGPNGSADEESSENYESDVECAYKTSNCQAVKCFKVHDQDVQHVFDIGMYKMFSQK